MFIRARRLLPLSQPVIENGALQVCRGRIESLGGWPELKQRFQPAAKDVIDLGEALLLPGLVNPHCHLNYTSLAGQIPPTRGFPDWVKSITALKSSMSDTEFLESWRQGAHMLLRHGITTVADVLSVPNLLASALASTPLRVVGFLEMTGVRSRRAPVQILEEALAIIDDPAARPLRFGLSPHAPYSTTPELLRRVAETARARALPVTMHIAESKEEFEMFMHGKGEMFRWIQRNEREMSDCGKGSPVACVKRQGLLQPGLLAVHLNYLAEGDVPLLAENGVQAVHCPRSHEYFRHDTFPYELLTRAGVPVSLGTDSLVSVKKEKGKEGSRATTLRLDLFEEMRCFHRHHPHVDPQTLVSMTTSIPAKGLGLGRCTGSFGPGKWADCIAIPDTAGTGDPYETVVAHKGPVSFLMIEGNRIPLSL